MAKVTFLQKLFIEYPIPRILSCWGSKPGVPPVEDIEVLIDSAISELASDVLIDASIEASGMITYMPEGTVTCTSATLSSIYPFQGNRLVKVTYEPATRQAYLRYYPAIIKYRRKMNREDLENLDGDRLIYFKSYCLWRMAEREIAILKAVNMNVDNGQIDLSVIEEFRKTHHDTYIRMKDEILLYSTVN